MTAVTRPAIVSRVSCHSGAYWIEFNVSDVSDAAERVDIALYERGSESTLEQPTCRLFPRWTTWVVHGWYMGRLDRIEEDVASSIYESERRRMM
jgi:hypothetical protein